jgi:hypothetical protein
MLKAITIFMLGIVFFSSCVVIDSYREREFVYYESQKKEFLNLKIPKGYADEKMVLDTTGGKEQYYYYKNGAVLYFSKHVVSWTTENQALIDSLQNSSKKKLQPDYSYKGVDRDRLHWKEIKIEDFRFGYSYVPSDDLERFETAVNSIRVH